MKKAKEVLTELQSLSGFRVLDDGFVRVVDKMGDDHSVVQAARVSYGNGTKTKREDAQLIDYLMRNKHTSPFEMAVIKCHIRVPIFVWRQWIRHRTASVSEYSSRYSVSIDSMMNTAPDQWRLQSEDNKQGSDGFLDEEVGRILTTKEQVLQASAWEVYQERLKCGVAREQARKDLPLSVYTEAYWKIDLRNLLHFLELRMHPHAQYEIRQYANVIGNEIVANWVPMCWEAFQKYNKGY
jgi:thymidylate synthase (FAD)